MQPLLLDMITYFQSQGLVEGDGVDAFRDFSPEEPDDIVVLYEYTGSPHVPHVELAHRSVQVTVRAKSADNARNRALELYKSLVTEEETQVIVFTKDEDDEKLRWGQVYLRQPPALLRRDESERTVYFFNTGITTNLD